MSKYVLPLNIRQYKLHLCVLAFSALLPSYAGLAEEPASARKYDLEKRIVANTAYAGDRSARVPQDAIQRVTDYFDNLTTIKGRFMHHTPDGAILPGQFYLQRPGKLRFDYDLPLQDFIVADGKMIYFWDGEMEQQSHLPITATPAHILLQDRFDLENAVTVTAIDQGADALSITLVQKDEPENGSLTLFFKTEQADGKLALQRWIITDSLGQKTAIDFLDLQQNVVLSKKLFRFQDPTFTANEYAE